MNEQNFEPKIIGSPDLKTRSKLQECTEIVLTFCNSNFEDLSILFAEEEYAFEEFKSFLSSKDPKRLLTEKYVDAQKINIPGIKTQKLIDQDMIEIPDKIFEVVLLGRETILEQLKNLPRNMNPINFLEFTKDGVITISENFSKLIINSTQAVTKSQIQNDILEQMEIIENAFNKLVDMEALSMTMGVKGCFTNLSRAFKHNRSRDVPNELNPLMFQMNVFTKGSRRYSKAMDNFL